LKKIIFIFGSYGNLGGYLIKYLKKQYRIISEKSFKKTTILNTKHLVKLINKYKPIAIVNCIAKTNVDFCEMYKNEANISNHIIIKNMIKSIKNTNCHFIQISTDQLYNGKNNKENSIKLINHYGVSKRKGEIEALKFKFSTILRTNFIGKNIAKKNSLSDWIVNSVKRKIKINTYSNIKFSPLHIGTLCKYILLVIKKKKYGIFNLGSSNNISKYDFSIRLCKKLNLDSKFINKTIYKKEFSLAERPLNMSLDVKKFEKQFNIKLPSINNEIKLTSRDYIK
jgi:dTDP-4-dehydrorhamnose reductase